MVVIMIGRKRSSAPGEWHRRGEMDVALGRDGEIDHHDAVLLDDADQQDDADQRDQTEIELNSISIASAPTPAEGKVERIVSGWM